ncbi:methylated-DNA--[protein]-cysteine S-methyltransferase [Geminisphaera colitermitum]|uniref:methylated-DNA--[protein]-cysteine S-methyltransferase n=1 Tax=Geminisphaera colitermitum TaxID=1148786 RepID=UPI000158C9E2|nr:methylated-DNA--[protein]-cysteine S-methyltransferase [Geminisphaera colitermitum]
MIFHYDTFFVSLLGGEFSIALDEHGSVAATAFGGVDALRERFPRASADASASSGFCLVRDANRVRPARKQVEDYFAGRRREFDLSLAAQGTEFQLRVWAALSAIPFGETRSYGDLARALKSSARAVGRANGANPIALIVPCHRVIGADGSLTGFAFGEDAKRRLLAHEGVEPWASELAL